MVCMHLGVVTMVYTQGLSHTIFINKDIQTDSPVTNDLFSLQLYAMDSVGVLILTARSMI